MIGDFFTKPLQGAKFRRFRNIIMNCDYDELGPVNPNDGLNITMRLPSMKHEPSRTNGSSGSQECVGGDSEWKLVESTKNTKRDKYIAKSRGLKGVTHKVVYRRNIVAAE